MFEELEIFVLLRNTPEFGLHEGDVGAIVHSYKEGELYEVEFVKGKGETIDVITSYSTDIRTIEQNEILHVREIKAA